MFNVIDRYFSFNRSLLMLIGLWPYEKSKYVQLQLIFIFSIFISGIVLQLTSFITSKCSAEIIIKVLSITFASSSFIVKYNAFYVNSETIKYLMEQIQQIYNDLRDNNEFDIIERYGNIAKYYTSGLTLAFFSATFITIGAQLWPDFTYIILSSNVSRSRHLQISVEYFIDQEKYFYLILFHVNVTVLIGSIVLTATAAMFTAYFQHACGMFKIASYRIEKAFMEMYILKNFNESNDILTHKSIMHAVDIHRKALIFSNCLVSRFEISFMVLIVIGVVTLSLNLFRIFQIVLCTHNLGDILLNFSIAFACLTYMFVSNFMGQQIIDHNNHVYATAYKVQWYVTPLHIQRLILLLLQRGNKSFGLNVGGLYIPSIESFAKLTNASLSYFTVMYSMR